MKDPQFSLTSASVSVEDGLPFLVHLPTHFLSVMVPVSGKGAGKEWDPQSPIKNYLRAFVTTTVTGTVQVPLPFSLELQYSKGQWKFGNGEETRFGMWLQEAFGLEASPPFPANFGRVESMKEVYLHRIQITAFDCIAVSSYCHTKGSIPE